MLVYDITQAATFQNIKNWLRNIEEVRFSMHVCIMCTPASRLILVFSFISMGTTMWRRCYWVINVIWPRKDKFLPKRLNL